MKLSNYVIIFLILLIGFAAIFNTKYYMLTRVEAKKRSCDRILESAAEDGAEALISLDRGAKPKIAKEEAVEVFFQSLYAGFGISQDIAAQKEIKNYIPVIMVADLDGLYFWYHAPFENGKKERAGFSEKYPFSYSFKDGPDQTEYYVNFHLKDTLCMMNASLLVPKIGTLNDLQETFPSCSLLKEERFVEERRRKTVSDTIMEKLEKYVNQYNNIAQKEGIKYNFFVPYEELENYGQTFDKISFLVLFEGYPLGNFITGRYHTAAFRAARLKKEV